MGYGVSGSMGYGFKSPAYQLGGSKNVWVTREYGLSGLWVMRESTVVNCISRMVTYGDSSSSYCYDELLENVAIRSSPDSLVQESLCMGYHLWSNSGLSSLLTPHI